MKMYVVTLRFGSHDGCVHNGTIQGTEYDNMNKDVSGWYYRSKLLSSIKMDKHISLNKGSGNNGSAVIDHTHEQHNTVFSKPSVQDNGIDLSQNHNVLLSSTLLLGDSALP